MHREQTITQTFLGLIGIVLLMFTGCNQFESILHEMTPDESEVGPVDNSVASANTKFGFNLFNEIRNN